MTEVIESRSEKDTFALGQKLGGDCRPGDIVLLNGDLGVGKTVFTKGFGKGLGIEEPISSPTFTIMQIYEVTDPLFKEYGKIIDSVELTELLAEMKHTPVPEDVVYVASEPKLEALAVMTVSYTHLTLPTILRV